MDFSPLNKPGLVATPVQTVDIERGAEHRELIQAVKAINGAELFGADSELRFMVDRHTQRPIIRLIDRETRTVIRQIPPEYVLRLAQELAAQEKHKAEAV